MARMTGFMFKVFNSVGDRWLIVALDNEEAAVAKLRAKIGDGFEMKSAPVPEQVITFLELSEGEIMQWSPA
ncbi:hypothetical protein BPTFM16_01827 [Altererythrobacter insulae]|nr:hypothetical protein BPTFM16_01827 [Altererythrobacter insulae]